ncbi:apolipoprotein N-acyltransferase [Agromyces sp. Marseille-Q5079]|uniref:apolipoprotein N-acyltransferase n=1 Tax=Agromyces sp. Marseille-Q5079 TaxID=3439059 RepID=UPI003D9CA97A
MNNPAVAAWTPMPVWVAVPVAAASGALLDAAFPDRGWWWAAPVAVTVLFACLLGRNFATGALVGAVSGGTFWLLHVEWLTLYLGPLPWIALSALETSLFALGAGAISVVLNRGAAHWPTPAGRFGLIPVVVAGLWTAREGLAAVWPYGGFAWGRLSISQVDGGFADLLPWLGAAGVSFVMAWLAAFSVQVLRYRPVMSWVPATAIAAVSLTLVALPGWPAGQEGTLRVVAVQGGADAGLFADNRAGDLLRAHRAATPGPEVGPVDVVVWPENSTDVDPLRSADSARVLDELSEVMGAPLVVGTITARGDEFFNTSLLWKAGEGATDWYDKAHPVPFAEYMPDRSFWRPFAPELVDLVTRDYSIGTRENVFALGEVLAGVSICFDIADDQLVTEMIKAGAQLILAQTNNADFGRTDESVQQLAIARMRALETARSVVNISTVGTSAIVHPDGSVNDQLSTWMPGSIVADVPLSTTMTPAIVIGRQIEWFVAGLGLSALVLVVSRPAWRSRRARPN